MCSSGFSPAVIYDVGAYQVAFGSLIACCAVGFLCIAAVRETYCRPWAPAP